MAAVQAFDITVHGRPCRYWSGGPAQAPPLLLLHGGLGDAALHWHHNFADLGAATSVCWPRCPRSGAPPPHPRRATRPIASGWRRSARRSA